MAVTNRTRDLRYVSPALEQLERRDLLVGSPPPDPFILMYGHYDGAGVTDTFEEMIPPFTVIEGTSTNANFINELRSQDRVYAKHVINPIGVSVTDLVNTWRAPFEDTLGGQLPDGYDAIAIDELHGATTNGTAHSNTVVAALQQLRSLYPDKGIYVAATWQYGYSAQNYTDQLNAINEYADIVMIENYLRETNLSYGFFAQWADNLRTQVPGILSKSVYGLGISQQGHVFDDSASVGMWGHLDEQFHRIRNDADASTMPGIMFWVYYRSETDVTPDYVRRLVDHYYTENNTDYFSDGNSSQLITNPLFANNTSGWSLQPGVGGTIQRFSYNGALGFDNDHSSFGWASHGANGLQMVRGSGQNNASFQVDGVDPNRVYTISAWVNADSPGQRATVAITESDGTLIASEEVTNAGTGTQWNEWSRIVFNFAPTSSTINVVLNDATTTPGTTLYWDFIELEEAYANPVANSPPTVPGPLSAANLLSNQATVSWGASTDPNNDPVTYELQFRRNGVSDSWSSSLFGSSTSRTLAGLNDGTSYDVRVRAGDAQASSGWRQQNNLFATESDGNTAPSVPDDLYVLPVLHDSATVWWGESTDAEGDPITYHVQYRKEDLSTPWSASVATNKSVLEISGLETNTTYRVRVRATDGQDNGNWNTTASLFTTDPPIFVSGFIGEVGSVSNLTDQPQTILLQQSYVDPVVFAQSPSFNGLDPVAVRLTDVESDRFTIYLQEPTNANGTHGQETVSYLVAESGTWQLPGGQLLEVGTVVTSATVGYQVVGSQFETVTFSNQFGETPVIVSQVQTANDPSFVKTRQDGAGGSGFQLALDGQESVTSSHGQETIGYLAIEPGSIAWGGIAFEAMLTGPLFDDTSVQLAFSQNFGQSPRFLSSLASYNGTDPSSLRYSGLTGSLVDLTVQEDTTANSETTHGSRESISYLAFGSSGLLSGHSVVGQVLGETGTLTNLTDQQQTILLRSSYDNPVVFAQSASRNGSDPVIVRVTDVQSDRFTIYLQEPSNLNGSHGAETVSYLVLEAGSWQLSDGTLVEVGTVSSGSTVGRQLADQWESISLNTPFDNTPTVLSQVQTTNDTSFVKTRQRDAVAGGFQLALEGEEDDSSAHGVETIGYLAIESGRGRLGVVEYEAFTTGSLYDETGVTLTFTEGFDQAPGLLSSLASFNGSDAAALRYDTLSETGIRVYVNEDTTFDAEIRHAPEAVSYLAFHGSGFITG